MINGGVRKVINVTSSTREDDLLYDLVGSDAGNCLPYLRYEGIFVSSLVEGEQGVAAKSEEPRLYSLLISKILGNQTHTHTTYRGYARCQERNVKLTQPSYQSSRNITHVLP